MARLWKNVVFAVSAVVILLLVLTGSLLPKVFGHVSSAIFLVTTQYFGWFFLLAVFLIPLFLIGLCFTKYGGLRLGGEKDRPEFPFFTWIGMLFSAGFGSGLVFWGVAEPMSHYFSPPFVAIESQSVEAARTAMGYAFFHWGISQWSIFALVGLVIGFLQFRKGQESLISTALQPVVGGRPTVRTIIDILAVVATVMGIATSIGLGVMQMNGGLNAVFHTSNSFLIQLVFIGAIFAVYMFSAISGIHKGMRFLSNLNLALAIGLLIFMLVMGPTVFILESFTLALGDYISNFISYSLRLTPYRGGTWIRDWTIFYWAWAIAWSPYVGSFVARVSRGRTVREFVLGVMTVPPLIACIWVAAFGGTALWHDLNFGAGIAEAVDADVNSALFRLFGEMPLALPLSVLSILLILTFLVTSADSATYVLASMTTGGSLNPPFLAKVMWGVLMSAAAGVLLYGGGLEALQTASLISALPFTAILLMMIAAMIRLLRREPLPIRKADLRRFQRLQEVANKEKETNWKKEKEKATHKK